MTINASLRAAQRELESLLQSTILEIVPSEGGEIKAIPADIATRMCRIVHPGNSGETFTLDGEPILWVGPLELTPTGFRQEYRRLGGKT